MSVDAQVLVVGTGPTGLTLACCLARHGVAVRVVEQRPGMPSMERGARGTAYQPRSLEVFDDLGVVDVALAEAWTDMPLRTYVEGKLVTDSSILAEQLPPTAEVPYPTMARPLQTWRMEQILWDRAAELGVKIEDGRRLVHLEADDDGVTAWIEDAQAGFEGWGHALEDSAQLGGDDLETRLRHADRIRVEYVVGCDGGRSTVRKLAGITYQTRRGPEEFDFVGMVADVRATGIEPTYARQWIGPDGSSIFLSPQPTTGNFQFITQLQPDEDGIYPEPTLEFAQRQVDKLCPIPNVRLYDMTWASLFKVRESLADRWRSGRVFVAGDAAHLHSAMGGQGANGGVQDAYNLGWKLAYVVGGDGREWLLDTYEQERRPVAEQTLQWTGDEHKAAHEEDGRGKTLLPLDAFVARMSQLHLSYPESGLNGGTRAYDRPTLGDRAPDGRIIDAETGHRLRLFDIYRGDQFDLLLFGTELVDVGDQVHKLYGDMVRTCVLKDVDDVVRPWSGRTFLDSHGRVRTSYQAQDRPIVLVRPDGYIAFHGEPGDADELLAHLHRILVPRTN